MRCDDVADALAASVDGTEPLNAEVNQHVEQCLRCQADLVQFRKLLRALRALRSEVIEPLPGLLGDILAHVEEMGERHLLRTMLRGRRVAYLGGLAAATAAAGAAGAIVLARSHRKRLSVAS